MQFVTKTPIEKGWSGDKKFCAVSPDGNKYFLRIAPLKKAERTRGAFEYQKRVAEFGVPMCVPIEIGETPEGDVYTVQSWIEGVSAEEAVRDLSPEEQYRYGVESGRILKLIHSIPAPPDAPDWEPRFNVKMDYKIKKYIECPIKVDGAECFINYIEQNRTLLRDRPQCFQHGDYHIVPGIPDMYPVVRRAAPQLRLRRMSAFSHSAPIPADPSASPRHIAES